MEGLGIIFILIVLAILVLWMFLYFVPLGLWFGAVFAKVYIPIAQLIGMRIRKVPPAIIINALVSATKAGLKSYNFV